MTAIPTTKADLLRAIETEQDWWRAVTDLAEANSPLTGDEPIDGSWTYKELLAHLDGWRNWTLARLRAAASGTGPPAPPWPDEFDEQTDAGTDAINAWFTESARTRPLNAVVDTLMDHLRQLSSVVDQMSEDDLLTPGRYPWVGDGSDPIGPALLGSSLAHVHQTHAPALEAWLTNNLGQHAELPPIPPTFGYGDE